MAHTRAERRWFRYVKGMRRLKQDRMEHSPYGQQTLEETCPCFGQPGTKEYGRTFSRFADTPAVCSGPCCGNPRKWYGMDTYCEQRAFMDPDVYGEYAEYKLGRMR